MWFKRCSTFQGSKGYPLSSGFYEPQKYNSGEPDTVYQCPELPWVFLGGKYQDDLDIAAKMAGKPICMRIDVTDEDLPDLLPATIKVPFPERMTWTEQDFSQMQNVFNKTVDNVVNLIQQNHCPIFIHCSMGANRSASVLAAALTKLEGKPLDSVLSEMRSIRPVVSPHDAYYLMALNYSPSDSPERKNKVRMMLDIDQIETQQEIQRQQTELEKSRLQRQQPVMVH